MFSAPGEAGDKRCLQRRPADANTPGNASGYLIKTLLRQGVSVCGGGGGNGIIGINFSRLLTIFTI